MLAGDLYETEQGRFFQLRATGAWYSVPDQGWADRIEIIAPAKARIDFWTRNGDKNRTQDALWNFEASALDLPRDA